MAYLNAVGHAHGKYKIENDVYDRLDIGSKEDWIEQRTGIRARYSVLSEAQIQQLKIDPGYLYEIRDNVESLAAFSARSWQMLQSRYSKMKLDTIIGSTSVPDFDIPANACVIAAEIGENCFSVDVNSACSSFIVGLHTARAYIDAGLSNDIGYFVTERYSMRMDYKDRTSCFLFGDGSASAVISNERKEGFEILDTLVVSSPDQCRKVVIADGDTFYQNGSAVQKFAITRTVEITLEILKRNNFAVDDVDYIIGHQANLRMLKSAVERIGVSEEKHLFNVDDYGNQGGAGAPIVLSQNWDRYKKGDLIVVSVVGAGLTWGSALLRFLG